MSITGEETGVEAIWLSKFVLLIAQLHRDGVCVWGVGAETKNQT
jgi:hypothetical protein